jgi:hypothetical protein
MNVAQRWVSTIVAGTLGVLVVSVLLGPRLLHVAEPPIIARTNAAATLPAGVCTLSPDNVPMSASTRLEAKLVTFGAAQSSDPHFPWHVYSVPASYARTNNPSQSPEPNYYWVVAALGEFHLGLPRDPQSSAGVTSFHDLVLYVTADTCVTRSIKADSHGWPAWFDNMSATAKIKFK